jgi:hypothetical protein
MLLYEHFVLPKQTENQQPVGKRKDSVGFVRVLFRYDTKMKDFNTLPTRSFQRMWTKDRDFIYLFKTKCCINVGQ